MDRSQVHPSAGWQYATLDDARGQTTDLIVGNSERVGTQSD